VVFPIEDGNLRDRVKHEVLDRVLADNVKARVLEADGAYRQLKPKRGSKAVRSQSEFIQSASAEPIPQRRTSREKARGPAMKLRARPGAA